MSCRRWCGILWGVLVAAAFVARAAEGLTDSAPPPGFNFRDQDDASFLRVTAFSGADGRPTAVLQPRPFRASSAPANATLSLLNNNDDSNRRNDNKSSSSSNNFELLNTVVGYGSGLPGASAVVLQALKNRNAGLYWQVMERLFGPKGGGHGYVNGSVAMTMVRVPIGACDFSAPPERSYDDTDGDWALHDFAVDPESELQLATVRDARSLNPRLTVMLTPWSPPGWMKTGGTMNGLSRDNTLLPTAQARKSLSMYLAKAAAAWERGGVHVDYMSLQNEPLFGTSAYPGMYVPSDLEAELGGLVAQAFEQLRARGELLQVPRLLAYDHNWDNFSYPLDVLSRASQHFVGTAWHCYAGDMRSAQDKVHRAFPEKETHVTECAGGYVDNKCDIANGWARFGQNHEWDMEHIFLGATANWASSGLKWLMALDASCGPVLPQVTWRWGRPLVSIPPHAASLDDIAWNQDYWTVGHMAPFLLPGSRRIASTLASSVPVKPLAAAFAPPRSPGGDYSSTGTTVADDYVIVMVLNTDHEHAVSFAVEADGGSRRVVFDVPAWGTAIAKVRLGRA